MRSRMQIVAGLMSVGMLVAAAAAEPITVRIENLAPEDGTYLTPVWVGFHDGTYDLFDVGAEAPAMLEALAEDGNTSLVMASFDASPAGTVQGTILSDSGIPPLAPGESATMSFELDGSMATSRYFQFASMVIPSNDAFIGNDDALMVFDGSGVFTEIDMIVAGLSVLDAGTEVNDELPENTAFFGQMMPNTGEDENGVVHLHPGFMPPGSGGILDDPRFANADFTEPGYQVARIRVMETPMLGDSNCDGVVNNFDIDAFVLALTDPAGYNALYPDCALTANDLDQNGRVDNFDIDPFMQRLAADQVELALVFDGLEPLEMDYVYEGWVIVDGAPVSTGRFVIGPDGETYPGSFYVSADDAASASMFVLTIEPADDPDPAPAATHVLAGGFESGSASLTIGHPAAIGDDFGGASGGFILATPTTADIDSDYDQGIWYVDPMAGPGPSLVLPTLPAGWAYEGWVVGDTGPISTGRFLTPSGADSDGAGSATGPDMAPPFPGQDYIDPPMSLLGYAAVISVEPEPDDSPAPFAIKPLVDMEIEDIMPPTLQSMVNNAGSAPTGTATLLP